MEINRNPPRSTETHLRRKAVRGRKNPLRLQHPEGVHPPSRLKTPRRSQEEKKEDLYQAQEEQAQEQEGQARRPQVLQGDWFILHSDYIQYPSSYPLRGVQPSVLSRRRGVLRRLPLWRLTDHTPRVVDDDISETILTLLKVDASGKITRTRRECPSEECGGGVFMAKHADRQYCGKCKQTFVFAKPEEGAAKAKK